MEQYKKSLRLQNTVSVILIAACAAIAVLGFSRILTPTYADEQWADFWNGLYSGMASSVCLFSLIGIIKNCIALKNEKKLRQQYIKANDERTQAIWAKAGGQSYWFIAGGLILGVVISGYFSPVVCLTILGCLLYFCLVRIGLKVFYSKKI